MGHFTYHLIGITELHRKTVSTSFYQQPSSEMAQQQKHSLPSLTAQVWPWQEEQPEFPKLSSHLHTRAMLSVPQLLSVNKQWNNEKGLGFFFF